MMSNLFSIFDPCTSELKMLNWMTVFLVYFFIPLNYFFIPSLLMMSFMEIYKKMYSEFNVFLKCYFSSMLFSCLMYFVYIYNFLGLFPYVFTLSSQIVFTLSFALSFWFAFMLFGWFNYFNFMMSHLLPLGTPLLLMPFMVLIESISLLIRPLTLSVRLAANMIAGHLLLCLIGSSGVMVMFTILLVVYIIQFCMYLLEGGVALIQAYVFSVLCSLYSSDVEFLKKKYEWNYFQVTYLLMYK